MRGKYEVTRRNARGFRHLLTKCRLCDSKRVRISVSRADCRDIFSLKEVSASWSLFWRSSMAAASFSAFSRALSLCSNLTARALARLLASARSPGKIHDSQISWQKSGTDATEKNKDNTFQLLWIVTVPYKLGTKTNKFFHQRLKKRQRKKKKSIYLM